MKVELKQVSIDEKEILRNLLEKYEYEFSQYDGKGVNNLGLFGYEYLDYYWTEKNRWAYFILADDKLAGFVMINDFPEAYDRETDFQLAEFFVLYKYRCLGVGKQAFYQTLNIHKGKWQLKCHPANLTSQHFWENAIKKYTKGKYELVKDYPNSQYADGSLGSIFFFDNQN